jgi:hypothetical protein
MFWFHYDRNGRYVGRSSSLLGSFVAFWLGVFAFILVFAWPLAVHGPLGILLEAAWLMVLGVAALWFFSSRGAHRGGAAAKAAEPPQAPVYDGDQPGSYEAPARPRGRSVGTKFQE